MCLTSLSAKTVGICLKTVVIGILFLQIMFGIALTIMSAVAFKEAAPEKPDHVEGEGQLQASLAMFHYAGSVVKYTDSHFAKACLTLVFCGIIMSGTGMLGFTSVASGKPKFLLVFLGILVVSSTAATYVATKFVGYRETAISSLYELMTWSLETQYDGNFNSTNRWSRLWDLGHITFGCCGINNGTDFDRASEFGKVYIGAINGTGENITGGFYDLSIPISCCRPALDYAVSDVLDALKTGDPIDQGKFKLQDVSCIMSPAENNSYINMGCKVRLEMAIHNFTALVKGFTISTFSLQVGLQLIIIAIVYSSVA